MNFSDAVYLDNWFPKTPAKKRLGYTNGMIDLQTIITPRSKLTVIEKLPFAIKRVYYLHGVNPDVQRAGHAHKDLRRLLIAAHGYFSVKLDGEIFTLNSPAEALLI